MYNHYFSLPKKSIKNNNFTIRSTYLKIWVKIERKLEAWQILKQCLFERFKMLVLLSTVLELSEMWICMIHITQFRVVDFEREAVLVAMSGQRRNLADLPYIYYEVTCSLPLVILIASFAAPASLLFDSSLCLN